MARISAPYTLLSERLSRFTSGDSRTTVYQCLSSRLTPIFYWSDSIISTRNVISFIQVYYPVYFQCVHTELIELDLKLDNILINFEDKFVLKDAAEHFQRAELPFKQSDDRRIFQSCNNFGPLRSYTTPPIIADFGLAVGGDFGAQPIQPDAYRAPEVILGCGWSKTTDLWNLGHLVRTDCSYHGVVS